MRRFLTILGPVSLALAGACHDFNTVRPYVARGTIGEEVFGVFCDRLAGQALREDLNGGSYRSVCHRQGGEYGDKVDEAKLPPPQAGLRDKSGNVVPLEAQQAARARAVGRVEALVRRRAELIDALDFMFPDADVQVLDIANKDPKSTCNPAPGNDGIRALGLELADMLGRMVDLYNDDTLPAQTRSLARVLDFFKRTPEAQASVARFTGRDGYRPPEIDIGVIRPIISYPRFRDLAAETLRLVSFDSQPYSLDPPRSPDGSRKRIPGPAYESFSKLLEVAHEELRTSKVSANAALKVDRDALVGLDRVSRPRENLEFASELFFMQDASFGGGAPKFIAKRDRRGFVALANASVEAPFVDKDKDGLPDVDALGRFLTVDESPAPTPFLTATGPQAKRDQFGRAEIVDQQLFDTVDTSHNVGAQLLADLRPLVDPAHEVVMNTLGGAYVVFGKRQKTSKTYEADPGRVDLWKLTHPANQPPPEDLGTQKVVVDFDAFDANSAPFVDFVYAVGQILGDRGTDDMVQFLRLLLTEHPAELASVAGEMLTFQEIAKKHDEAKLKGDSLFWDEVLDAIAEMTKDRALSEDVLEALADPAVVDVGNAIGNFMQFKDRISYDRANLNGDPMNQETGTPVPPKTPVNRGQPDTGLNRSDFQRLIQLVVEADGVAMCNKEGAVIHAKGIPIAGEITLPLAGTYKECEVFKIDNLARFYLGSITGKSQLYFRPSILRNGVAGIGASTVDTIQLSSGIQGFWDPPGARQFRPKPQWLNRLVYFDQANDSPNGGQNFVTNLFLRDLVGPHIGTAMCPERQINDPDPTAPDASSNGLVNGLRSCAPGQWLQERHPDTLFMLEHFNAYGSLAPLFKPFVDHGREDLLIKLFKAAHRHWQDDKGQPPECDSSNPKAANYCSHSNIVSYEPLLAEALPHGVFSALHELAKILQTTTISRCSKLNADKTCAQSAPIDGISVFADATEALISPDRAREVGLKDRFGNQRAKRNDGSENPQVTPIYLMTAALSGIDKAFVDAAAQDPANQDRQARWRAARSLLVDQFLRVDGTGKKSSFGNPIVSKVGPTLIDLLRAQSWSHCPSTFAPPYDRCTWARDDLARKMTENLQSPTFVSTLDVLDIIRRDPAASRELQNLLLYLTDPASKNEALSSTRAALTDAMQVLRTDDDLVPFYHIVAEAVANSVRDDQGNVVQTGMTDATTSLLSRLAARAKDAEGNFICSREIDPNQVLTIVLRNVVTPMKGQNGALGRTPFDVIVDVIGDVNRTDPSQTGRLEPTDLASAATEVSDFLMNKERGLEQFYRIIKNGTR